MFNDLSPLASNSRRVIPFPEPEFELPIFSERLETKLVEELTLLMSSDFCEFFGMHNLGHACLF
jgi:hypothetical protein